MGHVELKQLFHLIGAKYNSCFFHDSKQEVFIHWNELVSTAVPFSKRFGLSFLISSSTSEQSFCIHEGKEG